MEKSNKDIEKIMSILLDSSPLLEYNYKIGDGIDFMNGEGYVQHPIEKVNKCTEQIIDHSYSNGYLGTEEIYKSAKANCHKHKFRQNSVVGRYLEGTEYNTHWYRLMCIDSEGREWGQPYYAINSEKMPNIKKPPLNKYLRAQTIDKLLN